jgi:hypothetical protein
VAVNGGLEALENEEGVVKRKMKSTVRVVTVRNEPAPDEPKYYSLKATFAIYGISAATGYRRVKDGSIRTVKLGRRTLVPRESIAAATTPVEVK